MTKTAESIYFPNFGTFMLQVFAINATIEFNGTMDYSNIQPPPNAGALALNKSVDTYGLLLEAQMSFAANSTLARILPPDKQPVVPSTT
jgi:hypothetical protein